MRHVRAEAEKLLRYAILILMATAQSAAQQRQSLPGQPSRTRNRFMRTLLRRRLAASGWSWSRPNALRR
jgi:hypothetical protein